VLENTIFAPPRTMPRLVRRRPLGERIRSWLNPWDFLLWASETIEGYDLDELEKDWGLVIGITLNVVFLVARANGRSSGRKAIDDVFGEDEGVPWLSWLVSCAYYLRLMSCCKDIQADSRYLTLLGIIHSLLPRHFIGTERLLHLLSQAALSHV
jgi:hypothetical protein